MKNFRMTAALTAVTCICFFGTVACSKADEKAATAKETTEQAPAASAPAETKSAEAPAVQPPPSSDMLKKFGDTAPKSEAGGDTAAAAKINPAAPVAVVNGEPLTRSEYDRGMKAYVSKLSRATGGKHSAAITPNDQMKMDVLDEMIDKELLYQEARKHEPKDIDEKVKKEFDGVKARFKTEEEFKTALKSDNLDEKGLNTLIKKGLTVDSYIQTVLAPTVKVSDEAAKKFYEDNPKYFEMPEQIQASHILVKTEKGDSEDKVKAARAKAEGILAKLKGGADFAELAKTNSDCPSSAQGGDLGPFMRGQMVKPFEDAAFALKKGEMSDIVQTDFGFHVIKVTEKKESAKASFEDSKKQIVDYLSKGEVGNVIKAKAKALRDTAKIDLLAPHL
jgi:peptidyl-prolyl cis-trans isomerase C